jgi:hypothetical protein
MKIREGAYYRTRGGYVVGPMACVSWGDDTFTAMGHTWSEDGFFVRGRPYKLDLISEVYVSDTPPSDEPAAPPDAPKGSMLKPQDWRRLKPIEPSPETKTLRDEFAMAALSGRLANAVDDGSMDVEDWVSDAYLFADKMMEARNK